MTKDRNTSEMGNLSISTLVARCKRAGLGRPARRLAMLAFALAFFERPAAAYVDPGAGALLWQMVVAGLLGGLFYLRRITAWLRGRDRRQ